MSGRPIGFTIFGAEYVLESWRLWRSTWALTGKRVVAGVVAHDSWDSGKLAAKNSDKTPRKQQLARRLIV